MISAAAFVLVLLSGGTAASASTLTDSEKSLIREAVSRHLRSPTDARFSLPDRVGPGSYCGFVDAPNAFGGRSGWVAFKVQSRFNAQPRLIIESLEIDDMRGLSVDGPIANVCKALGYQP